MEFIVCMLLASLITGGRVTQDILATMRGTTPPHVERAKIRAEREKLRAEQRAAKTGGRSPYAAGKPRIRDVAAVYWGDALQNAIDAHNERRKEKQNRPPASGGVPVPKGESLAKRVWKLMTRPVGEKPDEPAVSQPGASGEPTAPPADGPIIACDECPATLINREGGWEHPEGSTCPKAQRSGSRTDKPAVDTPATTSPQGDGISTCPRCAGPVALSKLGRFCLSCDTVTTYRGNGHRKQICPDCDQPGYAVEVRPRTSMNANRESLPVFVHNLTGSVSCPTRAQIENERKAKSAINLDAPKPSPDEYQPQPRQSPPVFAPAPPDGGSAASDEAPSGGGYTWPRPDSDVYVWSCPDCRAEQRSTDPTRTGIPCDDCLSAKRNTTTEGNDDMTETANQTGSSATGDVHDLESAALQCDLLHDDLTAIDTALDVIDEKISSAGVAAEGIDTFLREKNVPDTVVGGLAQARDMLSPDRIKTLMDAIAAAKAGVQAAKEAITAMNDHATEALQGADGSVVNGR